MQLDQLAETPDSAVPQRLAGESRSTDWRRAIGVGLGLALLVGVLVTTFVWPAAKSAPRDVPVAVVGPAEAITQLNQQLAVIMPGALALQPADDAETARELIGDWQVYGAMLVLAAWLTAGLVLAALASRLRPVSQHPLVG